MRTLALPEAVARWSLTSLREKLVKIGAKVTAHARDAVFQIAEVTAPRALFRQILAGDRRPATIAAAGPMLSVTVDTSRAGRRRETRVRSQRKGHNLRRKGERRPVRPDADVIQALSQLQEHANHR